MQKVVILILVFLFTTSCSVTRKNIGSGSKKQTGDDNIFLLANVRDQNITKKNFNISKAEIEIVSDNDKKTILASVKYSKPDKYLISIKSKTGIEVARIYITSDTVLVNDRFNRILYYGSPDILYKRYGITKDLISLLFGDYNDLKCVSNDRYVCRNGRLEIVCTNENTEINYEIDCDRNKVIATILTSEIGRSEVMLSFNDFIRLENILLANEIKVTGLPGISIMKINIRKIDLPWDGVVEFIPGNRYEKIELL